VFIHNLKQMTKSWRDTEGAKILFERLSYRPSVKKSQTATVPPLLLAQAKNVHLINTLANNLTYSLSILLHLLPNLASVSRR
jgi:hypothetical protein